MIGYFEILAGFIVFLLLLYRYFTATYNFWVKRGVPGPKPELLFGTMRDVILQKISFGKYVKHVYDTYEDTSFIGVFKMREPILIMKDTKFIKDILIKDSSSVFHTRGLTVCENADPLQLSFFYMNGPKAHVFRKKISPLFTPSKVKDMFNIMAPSLERLDKYMEELLLKDNCIDITNLTLRLTIDMTCSFIGINMQTLTGPYENCGFLKYIELARNLDLKTKIKNIMKEYFPRLYNLIGYYLFKNYEITEFYTNYVLDIMKQRKKHGIVKSDFINSLMEIKENPGQFAEVTDKFFGAQMFGFLYASYESSSVTLCYTLYELALNQNIQDKVRGEIQNACKSAELQYEMIDMISYLNAIIKETLRKYAVADDLQRISVSSYTFRNTKLTIPKGQKIVIPLYAIHHDPKIYPNPQVYDPERFIDEATQLRDPIYYMPFGHGFRNCIGERSGILQVKLGLIGILRNYRVDICEQTSASYEYETGTIVHYPTKPIFLKMTRISKL